MEEIFINVRDFITDETYELSVNVDRDSINIYEPNKNEYDHEPNYFWDDITETITNIILEVYNDLYFDDVEHSKNCFGDDVHTATLNITLELPRYISKQLFLECVMCNEFGSYALIIEDIGRIAIDNADASYAGITCDDFN